MTTPGPIARTGAKWWADKMRDGFALDNGAPDESGGLLGMAAAKTRDLLTPEKVDAFEAALAVRMQAELDGRSTAYFFALKFSTDYGPGEGLADALEDVGLPTWSTILPFKTSMWADARGVRVGDGYRAEPQELPLLDSPGENNPPAGSGEKEKREEES